tara:strand:- start:7398 stop:7796 length:399 start_codon:yes stop_codon:yes gene_type:complete
MKASTKRNLAVLSAVVMSGYFGVKAIEEMGKGNMGYFLIGFSFAIGMGAAVIAIFKKPTEGKLYNTVVLLGGLPSLAFVGLAIWLMVTGNFTPGSLLLLIVGVVGLLTVNESISKNDEVDKAVEEAPAEANE